MGFAGILRQSTAVDVLIGPFVDSADGDAEETALTINQADVMLSKNGQTAAQKNDATAAAHDADGFYNCELDATDTNTVGQLTLYVHVAGALAVRHDFQVIEEAAYDQLFAASAPGAATVAALATVDGNVDSILADTADMQPKLGTPATDLAADIAAVPTAAENRAEMDSNSTQLAAIVEDTGTTLQAELDGIEAVVDLLILRTSTAQAGAATSITLDASASATNDTYNDCIVSVVSGTGSGQARHITDYTGATKVADVSPAWATNPSSDSVFVILPMGAVDIARWRDGVPNNLVSGRVDASTGAMQNNVVTAAAIAADAGAEIADAVYDEALAGHTTAGTAGERLGRIPNAAAGGNGGLPTVDASNFIAGVQGTKNTLDDLNDVSAAGVNAEVVDALNVDTYAEPGQGNPPATASLVQKLGYLYKNWRNRKTQTSSQYSLYDDAGTTIDQKAAVSDDATTAEKGEMATGA